METEFKPLINSLLFSQATTSYSLGDIDGVKQQYC